MHGVDKNYSAARSAFEKFDEQTQNDKHLSLQYMLACRTSRRKIIQEIRGPFYLLISGRAHALSAYDEGVCRYQKLLRLQPGDRQTGYPATNRSLPELFQGKCSNETGRPAGQPCISTRKCLTMIRVSGRTPKNSWPARSSTMNWCRPMRPSIFTAIRRDIGRNWSKRSMRIIRC